MKTIDLEEIKNQVAVKYGYDKWNYISSIRRNIYFNEVATEYAQQCCDEQKTESIDNIKRSISNITWLNKAVKAVLNTPNVVTTK